jgi:hypothetical protein
MSLVSFGLIAFALINNEPVFILVQRAESIPYILFVTNSLHRVVIPIENVISIMTNQEKEILLNTKDSRLFPLVEKYKSQLQEKTDIVLEWSLPKGRKGRKETALNGVSIAVREFEEETIFKKKHIEYIFKNDVYGYAITGTDNKRYSYILYPALINASTLLKLCEKNISNEQVENPKDLCIIFPNKTNETSNVSLMGINKIKTEKGITNELREFITTIYDDVVKLSHLCVH